MEKKFGKEAKAELESNGVPWLELDVYNERKYDHLTCPAGRDTRQRLYVINKGGAFLYKCFNCGGSGHFREREYYSPITEEKKLADAMHGNFDLTEKPLCDEAMLWLLNYEIDPEEFPGCFGQDSHAPSLQIAVYNGNVRMGFQRRWFHGPVRYYTRTQKETYCHYLIGKETPDVVFVVEDLISSYKIWSLGYSVVALLGTSLKGQWPEELKGARSVVVWLDNDSAGHAGAVKFVKEMSALFPSLYTMFDTQPKEVPYSKLTTICEAFK